MIGAAAGVVRRAVVTAADRVRGFIRWHLRPVDRARPTEWLEQNIKLPPGGAEIEPGPIKFDEAPYLREPIDCLVEPGVTDIVISGPTRIGKTIILRMVFALKIAFRPGPTLWVDATMPKAQSVVRKELKPLVNYNSVLAERKPANRHHFSNKEMLFPGAPFNVYGANSEAQVSGDTAEVVLNNEAAKFKGATAKEAAVLELVRHRTETFDNTRRHYTSSTPQTTSGLFWLEVEKGDKRVFEVPCPHCEHMQDLRWIDDTGPRVVWAPEARGVDGKWDLERVRRTARYKCANPACTGEPWTDELRLAAIRDRRARWKPTKDGQPGYRSYLLNGLYGRRKTNRMGELAVDFLAVRQLGFISDRQDWWNSRMGMPWIEEMSELSVKKLASLEREYFRGSLPAAFKPDFTILECDVQVNRMPWVLRAFANTGESHLVDHGEAPTWAALDAVQEAYLALARSYVIIDISFEDRRAEVLEQIWRRQDRGWIAAEGAEYFPERVKVETANVFMGGRAQGEKILVTKLLISTYHFKRELEERLLGNVRNWFLYQLPLIATDDERREFAEYKEQIMAHRRIPRRRKRAGLPAFEFKAARRDDHFADCEVYGLALAYVLIKKLPFIRRIPAGARKVMEVQR